MTDNWGYTALGRLSRTDFWDWFGPIAQADSNPFVESVYRSAKFEIGTTNQNKALLERGTNLIGFDGNQWVVGRMALPSSVLDPTKYPELEYAFEKEGNRPVHFMHGYVSKHRDLPTHVPLVDANHFREQHEARIIPLWDRSSKGEQNLAAERKVTSFEPMQNGVALDQHLPPDAVAALRKAHSEGRPIAIRYDAETQQWAEVKRFNSDLARARENHAERLALTGQPPQPSQGVPQTAPSGSAAVENAAEKAGENAKSWVARVWEHPGGKVAIIGGTVALGALLSYWVYKAKSEKTKGSQQSNAVG